MTPVLGPLCIVVKQLLLLIVVCRWHGHKIAWLQRLREKKDLIALWQPPKIRNDTWETEWKWLKELDPPVIYKNYGDLRKHYNKILSGARTKV